LLFLFTAFLTGSTDSLWSFKSQAWHFLGDLETRACWALIGDLLNEACPDSEEDCLDLIGDRGLVCKTR